MRQKRIWPTSPTRRTLAPSWSSIASPISSPVRTLFLPFGCAAPLAHENAATVATIGWCTTGRDFKPNEVLDVPDQVERLIQQATSIENLCQCYVGWYGGAPCGLHVHWRDTNCDSFRNSMDDAQVPILVGAFGSQCSLVPHLYTIVHIAYNFCTCCKRSMKKTTITLVTRLVIVRLVRIGPLRLGDVVKVDAAAPAHSLNLGGVPQDRLEPLVKSRRTPPLARGLDGGDPPAALRLRLGGQNVLDLLALDAEGVRLA